MNHTSSIQVSEVDVPDYTDVIAKPMDYSTVLGKLQGGAYNAAGGPLAFAADMRLIFTNALAYNWDTEQQCHLDAKQVCAVPRALSHVPCILHASTLHPVPCTPLVPRLVCPARLAGVADL